MDLEDSVAIGEKEVVFGIFFMGTIWDLYHTVGLSDFIWEIVGFQDISRPRNCQKVSENMWHKNVKIGD